MQRGKIITIVLCTVIVIALGVGGYFLFSYYKTSGISTNSVNKYQDLVDIVIDGGIGSIEKSTVVDCTEDEYKIVIISRNIFLKKVK